MSEFMEAMRQYGADLEGAMERFLDDETLYEECLRMFVGDAVFEQLRAALEAKEYKAAFDAAHTLKGVTANLGLTPLYEKICGIVEPLRAKDYSNLEQLYQEIVQAKAEFEAVLA